MSWLTLVTTLKLEFRAPADDRGLLREGALVAVVVDVVRGGLRVLVLLRLVVVSAIHTHAHLTHCCRRKCPIDSEFFPSSHASSSLV